MSMFLYNNCIYLYLSTGGTSYNDKTHYDINNYKYNHISIYNNIG